MPELTQPLRDRVLRTPLGRFLLEPVVTRRGLGMVLILFSAASFGAVTPFARIAYDAGLDVVTLMTARYGLATLAAVAYVIWRRTPWRLPRHQLLPTLILSIGLGALSLSYLGSVRYIPVSLAALIYYTYPILVSLLVFALAKERPSKKDRWSHIISFGGQMLSLGGLAIILGLSWNVLSLPGVLMAAFSALIYAIVLVFTGRLMRTLSPMIMNLYVALINLAMFTVIGALSGGFTLPSVTSGWIGLAGGSISFVAGFLSLFVGVSMIGSSRAACVSNLEPLVTIGLSIALLGEAFGAWQLIGAIAVLGGVFTMCRSLWKKDQIPTASSAESPSTVDGLQDCTVFCRSGSGCSLIGPTGLQENSRKSKHDDYVVRFN